jgi:putative colanic acid biosynthesis acetyltransferase WcaF
MTTGPNRPKLPHLPPIDFRDRMRRGIWGLVRALLFRPSPRRLHGWRRMLLRLFGARIASDAHIYPSAMIYAPWKLTMGPVSCLADGVDCYNVASITLGAHALASQRSFLCTASHDLDDPMLPLIGAPIVLEDHSWVTAEVFVSPGVRFHEGAVALARSVVTRDVPAWTVVAGHPAKVLRPRARPDGAAPDAPNSTGGIPAVAMRRRERQR